MIPPSLTNFGKNTLPHLHWHSPRPRLFVQTSDWLICFHLESQRKNGWIRRWINLEPLSVLTVHVQHKFNSNANTYLNMFRQNFFHIWWAIYAAWGQLFPLMHAVGLYQDINTLILPLLEKRFFTFVKIDPSFVDKTTLISFHFSCYLSYFHIIIHVINLRPSASAFRTSWTSCCWSLNPLNTSAQNESLTWQL